MATVTGTVYKVFDKTWPSKRPGGKANTTYSVKLVDNPIYYRTPRGEEKNSDGMRFAGIAEPGNVVRFDASPINENSAQITGDVIRVEEKTATVSAGALGLSSGSAGSVGGTGTYDSRDAVIQYQSSRKDALEFVGLIVTAGAVKLPAKESAKLEALEALVDFYTAAYFADIETKGAVARAAGEEETSATEPAKPASDDAE